MEREREREREGERERERGGSSWLANPVPGRSRLVLDIVIAVLLSILENACCNHPLSSLSHTQLLSITVTLLTPSSLSLRLSLMLPCLTELQGSDYLAVSLSRSLTLPLIFSLSLSISLPPFCFLPMGRQYNRDPCGHAAGPQTKV